MFFATASGPLVQQAMDAGLLGQIAAPGGGSRLRPGRDWCADNAAFGGKYPGDGAYLRWLADRVHFADRCRFATAPDVVGDAVATLALSVPMLSRIRTVGYPAALVAQNGVEHVEIPWTDFDALFIGGDDEFKLGPVARRVVVEAKKRTKWVHMGRVNSRRRLQYADAIGCDSVDGTYLAFGPDTNLPTLLSWMRELRQQPALWGAA